MGKRKVKVHSLTGRITPKVMRQAFQAVRRNRGAAGVDKVSVQMFANNLEANLAALMRALKTGTYRPRPLRQGHTVVLDADIAGFFDNIPHRVIMEAVAAEVADGNILRLVERFLTAGVMEDGVFKPTRIGTPQGGVISPLLANIVLNHLDWRLHEAGYHFVRYADDFVVVCQTRRQVQEARTLVQHVLEDHLGLRLNPEKTAVTSFGKGYDFLGFTLSPRSRRMREKSVQKFKAKVRELTVRKHNLDACVVVKLNRVIRGTANYFATSFSTCRWTFQKLDSWVRMRLRAMKLGRKNYNDNRKLRVPYFRRKLGVLTLEESCSYRDARGQARRVIPRRGATSIGVAR
ncbi:MAG: reverse transcriptase domain-containing protein [Planctomycetota bacterium]|jgi:hypothetical protein